jgi:hypothetical protein
VQEWGCGGGVAAAAAAAVVGVLVLVLVVVLFLVYQRNQQLPRHARQVAAGAVEKHVCGKAVAGGRALLLEQ